MPRIENGGPFAVDFVNGRRDGITLSSACTQGFLGSICGRRRDRRPAWCATTFSGPALALQELVLWYTIHNAGRAGNRGKSKRRLKATPVLG